MPGVFDWMRGYHGIISVVSVQFSKNATKWPAMWAILFLWDSTGTHTKEEMPGIDGKDS